MSGLCLIGLTARPRKVFLVQYRAAGKVEREKLGDWFSELTAAQARKKADVIRGKVRDHRDPVGERKAAEAAARASEQQAKRAAEADAFTLRKLVQAWETRALSLRREGYRKEATARVRQGLAALLDRPAASLARTDAAAALEELATSRGAIAANRVMAYARACYGWAAKANLVEFEPIRCTCRPQWRERTGSRSDGRRGSEDLGGSRGASALPAWVHPVSAADPAATHRSSWRDVVGDQHRHGDVDDP